MTFRKQWVILAKNIVLLPFAVHCLIEYGGELVYVNIENCSGPSMEPTIVSGEVLITKSVKIMKMDKIKRGDIVVARSPTHPGINICKRVAGLPGDKITHNRFFTVSIPPGHMWLEGDNSNNSTDSRTYGPIPQGLIRGKAICRIFPLSRVTCDFTYENKVR